MPTLQRFGAVKVCMYADDHRPPHFHVVGPDFQLLVRISDLTVMVTRGDVRPSQIAEAIGWARDNAEGLAVKWVELNERG